MVRPAQACFGTASGSGPSADATAGLLSARTGRLLGASLDHLIAANEQ
jgi:hypothetical protein